MLQNTIKSLRVRRRSKKGFTLMEMLIVVAIIAILVAVSIPVFNVQLDKARQATDDANMRAAKAVAETTYLVSTYDNSVSNLATGAVYNITTGKFDQSLSNYTATGGYGKYSTDKGCVIEVTTAETGSGNLVLSWAAGTKTS